MLDVCRLIGSIYDESRCTDEISILESWDSWRVRAGVGYVMLEVEEYTEAEDDGEDSCRLSTLVPPPPYDKSG